MFQRNGVDLDWSTFFKLKNKADEITRIKEETNGYKPESVGLALDYNEIQPHDGLYYAACETAVLRFCIKNSNFASDFLSEDDLDKAYKQFERKQYTSKLLRELLAYFDTLWHNVRFSRAQEGECWKYFKYLVMQDVVNTLKELKDAQVEKSFSDLKKVVETVASGVKSECYLIAEEGSRYAGDILTDELNKFVFDKYGYNLNGFDYYSLKAYEIIYKKALFNSDEFWKQHEKFDVFVFVNCVAEFNDLKRSQKILSYMFDNICADEIGSKLVAGGLPLKYLFKQQFVNQVESSLRYKFNRFKDVYDLTKLEREPLCYPLLKTDDSESHIEIGKKIVNGLFGTVYPNDSERVLAFFNEQLITDDPCRLGVKDGYSGYTVRDLFVAHTLSEWFIVGYTNACEVVQIYCRDYFSVENMWNRIYLIAYAMSLLESDALKRYANLFEMFYSLFAAVEATLKVKTSFQTDAAGRDGAYLQLKQIAASYGVKLSDGFKSDYVTSLLDRKIATLDEIARFPALEQLGDAIYGLAVAEMMFYQPAEIEDESIFNDYEKYVQASAQVAIARKIGLDKLYISSLSLSYKGELTTIIGQNTDGDDDKFKYLADSLEMVIGAICKDCGYQAAIDFTKSVVKATYPDVFIREVRWEDRFELSADEEIDWEYWNRILRPPFSEYYSYSSQALVERMWRALDKFMLTYAIGTDGEAERNFITQRHSRAEYGDELYGSRRLANFSVNYALYHYLHNGLKYVVENYSEVIKRNYEKLNRE